MEDETITCAECGAENPLDADACMACGADLVPASGALAKIPTPALLGAVALILVIVLGVLARTLYTKSRPSSHTQAGQNYFESGDHANAQKEFLAALKYNGRYEGAIIGLAQVGAATNDAALLGKYAKPAITTLDKGPLRAEIRVAYAWTLLDEGKFSEANNQAIDAVDDDENVKGVDALRGLAALKMTPPAEDDAILYLKKAANAESKRPDVYLALSTLLLAREDFETGESITKGGLELDEKSLELWSLLAKHRRGRKNVAGERKALQTALTIDAENADIHSRLSKACLELKDPTGAQNHAEKAAKIAPDDGDAQLALGRILLVNGKPKNALNALEKALKLKPGNWEIEYLLGKAQARTDDPKKGVRSMIKAIKGREKEHPKLVEEVAAIGVQAGSREAEAFLREQVQRLPDSYELNFLYAKLLIGNRNAKNKEREIKQLLNQCLQIDKSRKDAPFLLGTFLNEIDKPVEAIAAWKQGLESHEDDPDLLGAIGRAALDLKRWDDAIQALDRLVKLKPDDREAKANLKRAQDGKFFDGN